MKNSEAVSNMFNTFSALSLISLIVFVFATDISDKAFGNLDDAIPAAYGDFNSDELTDVFVLRKEFTTIDILLGSDVGDQLLHQANLKCFYPNKKITSVVPGDYDGDAFMDVMFTVKLDGDEVGVYVNYGGSNHINCTANETEPIIKMIGEPLALDYDDDMVIDLFGMNKDGMRTFWIFGKDRGSPRSIQMSDKSYPKLSLPHSHSFLDLNGDFLADLFVTTQDNHAEIWLATDEPSKHFEYNRTIPYIVGGPKKLYGQSMFIDIELNGNLNQLLPVCNDEYCKNSTICVQTGEHFHDLNINFNQDDDKTQWGFLVPEPNGEFYKRAITLRSGDFNNDGYPDLLVTLQKNNGKIIQTFLMENVKDVNAKPSDTFKRTFAVRWNALMPFGENTVMGSFYDFYQDGILDVILVQKNGDKYKPVAFGNTLDYDANFVKVIVLTGLTNKKPPAKETPFGAKRRNYGNNL